MRALLLGTGLLLLGACTVERTPATGGGVAATVVALEQARFAAMVAGDTTALGRYLAADLSYTHSSGARENRAQYLQHLAAGQLQYRRIEPESLDVRVLGQAAVITGRARLVLAADSFTIRYTDVWSRADGQWRMIAWQATRAN